MGRAGAGIAIAVALIAAGCAGPVGVAPTPDPPAASASAPLHFGASGFFRTVHRKSRWWMVTPDGVPFYSSGVNHVTPSPDVDRTTGTCPYCEAIAAKYPSTEAWSKATVQRLRAWGFNTMGSWSDMSRFAGRMPDVSLLSMASGDDWFSPDFVAHAQAVAAGEVAARRDDRNLIGWILDSELRWTADWRSPTTLLAEYLALPQGTPGRAVADQYPGNPNGFLRVLAERYFQVTTSAIRAQDPNHLILGVKMIAQLTPREVLVAARRYVDVFTVDDYALLPGLDDQIRQTWGPFVPVDTAMASQYAVLHKPIMIAEYSYRAADSGVPNSYPPIFPTVATQQQRADAYAAFVSSLYAAPWIVGDTWFEFADEPAGGRFDGEDSNFGVVSNADVPWTTLVDRMTQLHAIAPDRLADPAPPCWSWQRIGRGRSARCVDQGGSSAPLVP